MTYCWKALNKDYNFALDLIIIGGLQAKLWVLKVAIVLIVGIPGLPFGSFGTKCHLDANPVERHKVNYKGKGDGFPQFQAMLNLMSPSLPVVCPSTKGAQTM